MQKKRDSQHAGVIYLLGAYQTSMHHGPRSSDIRKDTMIMHYETRYAAFYSIDCRSDW